MGKHVIQEKDNLEDNGVPPTPSEPVEIQEIGKDDTETFTRIYAEAFDYPAAIAQPLCRSAELLIGEPDVLSYVATISGEPVSVGQLFLSAHGAAFLGAPARCLPPAARAAKPFSTAGESPMRKRQDMASCAGLLLSNRQSWRSALKVGFRPVFREDIYAPSELVELPKAADSQAAAHGGGCCSTEVAAAGR